MILFGLAFAYPVTWVGDEPASTRVELTAASWDPVSRAQIERLLPVMGTLDLAVVALQDADAWEPLRAAYPDLHVGTKQKLDHGEGMLGVLRIVEDGRVRFERRLARLDDDSGVQAVQAFRRGDRKALRKLGKVRRSPRVPWPTHPETTSVNDAYSAIDTLIAHEDPGSFQRLEHRASLENRAVPFVAYGTPSTNPLLASILSHHGITLDAEGVQWGDTRIEAVDPVLIAALPNPWNAEANVVVYATLALGDDPLNALFHGPTSATVGTGTDVVAAFDLVPTAEGVRPLLGASELTAAQAVEDLRTLDAQLHANYSGLPALTWRLGQPWTARTERFVERLESRPTWTWADFSALVIEDYLEPVDDFHFTIQGASTEGTARARLVDRLRPWFTELRVTRDGERYRVTHGPLVGERLELDPVPDPSRVEPGVPYAFPTVLQDGSPAFLVGVFAPDDPGTLTLANTDLPVHRSQSTLAERADPWSYEPDAVLPTVSARTMLDDSMQGFHAGTEGAQSHRTLLLDLRANHGGNDLHARRFMVRFDARPYRSSGGSNLAADGSWTGWATATFHADGHVWPGERLWVLVDGGVASSGESFAMLAQQLPQAKLVGTATAGCTENGNLRTQAPLPHSALVTTYGHTRFVWSDVRPIDEGTGMFPDLWLDEPDPVGFLAGLPAQP